MDNIIRCPWAGTDSDYINYHDNEWGRPSHDERHLFEMLILEGMQAGLSWITILKKRENFRKAFDNFDPVIIAAYSEEKIAELLEDKGIIRNRLKIRGAVANARGFLEIQKEFGSFDKYIWGFVDNEPIVNAFESTAGMPANTDISDKISKDLKKRGFKFVGSTIIYSFMQAVGMVNDHITGCHVYRECGK